MNLVMKSKMEELSDTYDRYSVYNSMQGYEDGFMAAVEIMEAREKELVEAFKLMYQEQLAVDRSNGEWILKHRTTLKQLGYE